MTHLRPKPRWLSSLFTRHRKTDKTRNARALFAESLEDRRMLAVDATLSLGVPEITGLVARFSVTLDFQATEGERLSYFSLDVEPSSPSLIGPGPDFSAFTFDPQSPLLDDWRQIGFFNDPGFESSVEFDDDLIASLAAGTYQLGTLAVDFGAAGLTLVDAFTVAINGSGTIIGVEESGGAFEFEDVEFNPASRLVGIVGVDGPATIAEGSNYPLMIRVPRNLGGTLLIDWGDGQQTSLAVADLPSSGEVTHVYPDGPATQTISVELELPAGDRLAVGDLDVTVLNVTPVLTLTAEDSATEGIPFVLSLGSVVDPGVDIPTSYVINWGDGQEQTISESELPANRQVIHVYEDGPPAPTITVDVVDDDGTHPAVANLSIELIQKIPEIELLGESTATVGEPYVLTVGGLSGPGSERIDRLVIEWGDGARTEIPISELPDDRRLEHVYAGPAGNLTLRLQLLDDQGVVLGEVTRELELIGGGEIVVDRFDNTAAVPGETDRSEVVTVTGELTVPAGTPLPTAVLDWGDGSEPITVQIEPVPGGGRFELARQFIEGGVYLIELTLTTPAGVITRQTRAYVTGFRRDAGVLQIVGSEGNDIVTVTPQGASQIFVSITTPVTGNIRRTFSLSDVLGVDVYVGAGNDRIMVSDRLTIPTYLDGGPGHDHAQGGDGPNFILGGPGSDTLLGGDDRDILVAGEHKNLVLGYEGDDALLGGIFFQPVEKRAEIFSVWESDVPLEERQATINELIDAAEDTTADELFGGTGENLFYASLSDLIRDASNVGYSVSEAIDFGWAVPHPRWSGIYTVLIDPHQAPPESVPLADDSEESLVANAEPEPEPIAELQHDETKPVELPPNPLDVNGDGHVTPIDVVVVINGLNAQNLGQVRTASPRFDPDLNGWLTPADALIIVNHLNSVTAELLADKARLAAEAEDAADVTPSGEQENVGSLSASGHEDSTFDDSPSIDIVANDPPKAEENAGDESQVNFSDDDGLECLIEHLAAALTCENRE